MILFSHLAWILVNLRLECQFLLKFLFQKLLNDFFLLRIFVMQSFNFVMQVFLFSVLSSINDKFRCLINLRSKWARFFFFESFFTYQVLLLFKELLLSLYKIIWQWLKWHISDLWFERVFNWRNLCLFFYFFCSVFYSFMRIFNKPVDDWHWFILSSNLFWYLIDLRSKQASLSFFISLCTQFLMLLFLLPLNFIYSFEKRFLLYLKFRCWAWMKCVFFHSFLFDLLSHFFLFIFTLFQKSN